MNREATGKLRAGNTLYVVGMANGMVYEMYVRKVERAQGYPLVWGDTRAIMSRGVEVLNGETTPNAGCWFAPSEPAEQDFDDNMHRQTRSRKQAIRWAKEGFLLYGKPLQIVFKVTPVASVEQPVEQPA